MPMSFEFGLVDCEDDLAAVQRLRYDVYVEELGRYRSAADHAGRRLAEPEDERSWVFYARDGDEVVGASRLTWGAHGLSDRQVAQYQLTPFVDELGSTMLAVGERATVRPHLRGTTLLEDMLQPAEQLMIDHGVRLVFGCCEPHLLNLYLAMGQRPYADRNINSPEAGYLIPLVAFVPDGEPLRGADCVERIVLGASTVSSSTLMGESAYWSEVRRGFTLLHDETIGPFHDLTDEEIGRCIARSTILSCNAGDRVLRKGGTARNIFVVLDGTLEVHHDDRVISVLTPGDVFGEMAFLLQRPRAFDVDAATDGVRVLSLSEGALRRMIADDAVVAAKLLLNVSKMLCRRLIKADTTAGGPLSHDGA